MRLHYTSCTEHRDCAIVTPLTDAGVFLTEQAEHETNDQVAKLPYVAPSVEPRKAEPAPAAVTQDAPRILPVAVVAGLALVISIIALALELAR